MWSKKGFSLVELLVALGVLSVITAGIVSLIGRGPQQKARDSRRQSEVQRLVSALEIYRNDTGTYPRCSGSAASCNTTATVNGTSMTAFPGTYLQSLPSDASPRQFKYAPYRAGGSGTCAGNTGQRCVGYIICMALESPPSGSSASAVCGTCGTVACNYEVRSP